MKIISNFHDYYDSVQGLAHNADLLYLRERNEAVFKDSNFPTYFWEHYRAEIGFRHYIIGLCGMVYPLVIINKKYAHKEAICFNINEVDVFIRTNFKTREFDEYNSTHQRYRKRWFSPIHKDFVSFFEAEKLAQNKYKDQFLKAPIFIIDMSEQKITYNAQLKSFEFYRVVDTYSAFQQIEMYLTNMGKPEKPIPTMSDKDMIAIKGFDEWSFRKEPKEEY